jgi:hypothetical protein
MMVVLSLNWTPHSRVDALAFAPDGRIPAPALRALFTGLRSQGPADILCPPHRWNALPEMKFFSPESQIGCFVYYKTGENDKTGPAPASFTPLFSIS